MSPGIRLLSFLVAFAAAASLTPVLGRAARALGILDHPHGHKTHAHAIPYLGGLAVAAGVLLVAALGSGPTAQARTVLVCALIVAGLGLADDRAAVGPIPKLVVEAATGLALWGVGIRAGLFGDPVADLLLTVLWVVAVTNAMNIVDNMDGLASGLAAISALGLFAIAIGRGDHLVATLALATAGAALGFLWHNFPPAKIYLGDAGSLFLGFLLAAIVLHLDLVGANGAQRSAIAVLAVGVCLFDLGLVVVARALDRRPVYLGATDHTSHRLAARGLTPRAIAVFAYAVQLACSGIAFALSRVDGVVVATAALVVSGAIALLAFAFLLRLTPLVVALPEPEPTRRPELPTMHRLTEDRV